MNVCYNKGNIYIFYINFRNIVLILRRTQEVHKSVNICSKLIQCNRNEYNHNNRKDLLETDFGYHRHCEIGLDSVVHERMSLNKIHGHIWKCSRVVNASTGSWFRHPFCRYSQPIAVYRLLLLERTLEDFENTVHGEGADRWTTDGIYRSCEDTIYQSCTITSVKSFGYVTRWFCKIIEQNNGLLDLLNENKYDCFLNTFYYYYYFLFRFSLFFLFFYFFI